MTNRRTPASTIASVQGLVRPVVEHGSSVTYKMALFGIGPLNWRRHSISACGRTSTSVMPFCDNLSIDHENRADGRIGAGLPQRLTSFIQRRAHEELVVSRLYRHAQRYLA